MALESPGPGWLFCPADRPERFEKAAVAADVVILDHHLALETLPQALAIVNPNRQDEDGSLAHLCAAGVVFLLLVEMVV